MPFFPSSYPNLVKAKKRKKKEETTLYLKLKQSFISVIDEKAFADFYNYGGSHIFVWWLLFIQKVHDEEIT